MRRGSTALGWAIGIAAALSLACAHYFENRQTLEIRADEGYRFADLTHEGNSDSLFICLTFSGGGTRAAAFSYGVMTELNNTRIVVKDPETGESVERSLLDEVDCISSVSGGSFTSAYYGLFRDRLFEDYRERFLERNIQGALIGQLFNPVNWARMASPYFGRIDLAAEIYRDEVFDAKPTDDEPKPPVQTFAYLRAQGRPFLMINATNLETGSRFDFTGLYFDAMGSRLDDYPVARAVAASSAFPFLLSPISLVNYPRAEGYREPFWYDAKLESFDVSRRRYQSSVDLAYYLATEPPKSKSQPRPAAQPAPKKHEYIHVMDGGLADNIGARGAVLWRARGARAR